MAFRLGQTREDIEKEQAQQIREIEYEIQEKNRLRQEKVAKLKRKNRANKIIVITITSILLLSLLTFGIYNSFFKKSLTSEEVVQLIEANTIKFNDTGVDGFLRENIPTVINNYLTINSDITEKYTLDANSIRVNKVIPLDYYSELVYFSCDVNIKDIDVNEKDKDGKTVTKTGATHKERFSFYVIVTTNIVDGRNLGYKFGSDLGYVNDDIYGSSNIVEVSNISFEGIEPDSEEVILTKRTKVDRILADLYSDKQVGSDFSGALILEEGHPTYNGITEFTSYTANNQVGFNAKCVYTVTTSNNVVVKKVAYMYIEQNGQSWKISKFL